ncbi:hypothetical protein BC828DRAFT_375017 [Blastocladiella britannica]|nr:hypothetical protein BC828DRAFT_375017 [Blastocladiella britannica]
MDAALLARATNATHAQKEQAADALDLAIPPAGSNPTMSDASTGAAAAPVAAKPRGHLLRRGSRESNGSSGSGSERPRGFLTRIASSGIVLAPSSALAAGAAATSAAAAAANSASHALGSIESMDSTDTTLLAGGAQYVAVAAFLARAEDEMSAMRGDRVAVYRVLTDGWCLGMNLDMDRHVGFFPHYVVEE